MQRLIAEIAFVSCTECSWAAENNGLWKRLWNRRQPYFWGFSLPRVCNILDACGKWPVPVVGCIRSLMSFQKWPGYCCTDHYGETRSYVHFGRRKTIYWPYRSNSRAVGLENVNSSETKWDETLPSRLEVKTENIHLKTFVNSASREGDYATQWKLLLIGLMLLIAARTNL